MRRGHLEWGLDPRGLLGPHDTIVNVRCNHCLGCDHATQRDWALRSFHEALTHNADWRDADTGVTTKLPNSCVITLTYKPEHLPKDGALNHEDFVRFMKRLRIKRVRDAERVGASPPPPIRMFMCGEYGLKGRPHFHAVLYGCTFSDQYKEQSKDGQINIMSNELDKLWGKGRATLDQFTFAAASYVAGYVAKKTQEPHRGPWTETVNTQTGEWVILPLSPEYRKMSVRLGKPKDKLPGGLGGLWLKENLLRTYKTDTCRISKYLFRPPKYYDRLLRDYRPDLIDQVKLKRIEHMEESVNEWTPERCSAAETIEIAKLQSRSESLD